MAETNPEALKAYALLFFSKLDGAVTSAMIHLGGKLGLYHAMAAASEPLSSDALARRLGLHERWVREWLYNQAAARLVQIDVGERFSLSPEAVAVMTDPEHPAYGMGWFERLPDAMRVVTQLDESFRTGIGFDYDEFGEIGAAGIERAFAPWYRNFLVPVALPFLDGVEAKLAAGATVVDIGCGAGVAVITMAEAFPSSTFRGYDISQHALARAREKLADSGLANASFHDARHDPLPDDHSVDLITTFDCIHDMTHPTDMMCAIRSALDDSGTWLLVDIKARDTYAENAARNPMASMMYGISVLSCMSSAMSEPGGEGLGTLGLPASKAEAMAGAAGFSRFRVLDVPHAINAFYELRP